MIDYNYLENLRKNYLNKFITLCLIWSGGLIFCFFKFGLELFSNFIVATAFVTFFGLLGVYIYGISKKFETVVKRECIPSLLKNLVGENDKIYWKENKKYSANEKLAKPDYVNDNVDFDTQKTVEKVLNSYTNEYDDTFFGTYKGTDFSIIEVKADKRYRGVIVGIKLNKFINEKIMLLKAPNPYYPGIRLGLKKCYDIKIKGFKYSIYAEIGSEIKNVVTEKFVNYINNLNKSYEYVFIDDYLYILCGYSSKFDYFKLGSLFKKVYDGVQSAKFKKEFTDKLKIVEIFSGLKY